MNITIELGEFWMDEDTDSFETELKKYIINEAVQKIQNTLKKKIEDEITRTVKSSVENILFKKMSGEVAKLIEIGEIKFGGEMITIENFIKNEFEKNTGWRSPDEKIKEIAKKWGDTMKNRYDRLFAVHIVEKIREVGLLKDDRVADLLKVE